MSGFVCSSHLTYSANTAGNADSPSRPAQPMCTSFKCTYEAGAQRTDITAYFCVDNSPRAEPSLKVPPLRSDRSRCVFLFLKLGHGLRSGHLHALRVRHRNASHASGGGIRGVGSQVLCGIGLVEVFRAVLVVVVAALKQCHRVSSTKITYG
jgi:hypothetical protein